jgi:phosphotransferase system HPr (HPr) family protein
MKLTLTDALHARPASLLVKLASQHAARIEVRTARGSANAKDILGILGLGAAKGDPIEIVAEGDGAGDALTALAALVEQGFDSDLVPELGAVASAGIAIGRAVVIARPEEREADGGANDEIARLRGAIADVQRELAVLVASLPPAESALFEPERTIVAALEAPLLARLARGERAAAAIVAETEMKASDLFDDARARLLAAIGVTASATRALAEAAVEVEGELVAVLEEVTPSVIAALPERVTGVVGVEADVAQTSHAAILARGRGLPLVFVPSYVAASIASGDVLVIDATGASARVFVAPAEALVEDARHRQRRAQDDRREAETRTRAPLAHLGVAMRVNVGSLRDPIPPGAEGVGLVRSELLFADARRAPSFEQQRASYAAIASRAGGHPVIVRLFDAGGDKPLPWLSGSPDARGIALLRESPARLDEQLRAIAAAAASGDVRVLLPLTRGAEDVELVRALCGSLPVGAMIETRAAAEDADAIAAVADFVCIGTNDLAADVLGLPRGDARAALDRRVLALVERTTLAAHARDRSVTVCGELAGDDEGAQVLVGLGVDALSVAPSRLAPIKAALASSTLEACREAARSALR